ncbi:MAG: DNA polymerase elongation subunit (family B) [Candidatus Poriferisodalaceae bacterium]|jgi:DNA polymerase elongation subunit (family B)
MIHDALPVYGLDIETDTAVDGLDPAVSAIIAIAVTGPAVTGPAAAGNGGCRVFSGAEAHILTELDDHMRQLPPGVVVTWNGSGFDLPFLVERAARSGAPSGLRTRLDPQLATRTPLPGHTGSYRGVWQSNEGLPHLHLDAYRVYRNDLHRLLDLSCSLKSVAGFVGLELVEFDASKVHEP